MVRFVKRVDIKMSKPDDDDDDAVSSGSETESESEEDEDTVSNLLHFTLSVITLFFFLRLIVI